MNVTINTTEEELRIIEKALELYGRVGLLQFQYLTICDSLQRQVWGKDLTQEFDEKTFELKSIFGYSRNSNPGIFNKEFVSDDCRIAFHLQHQMRHERYLNRTKNGKQTERHYTVDEYPADVCDIAGIEQPNFKITIHE